MEGSYDAVGGSGDVQRDFDGRFLGRRPPAPGDGVVREARVPAPGAEERPEYALEDGRLPRAVRSHDADGPLRREQFHAVAELLEVLHDQTFQDHGRSPPP